MSDERRAMYDGWSTGGAHSKEWGQITEVFLEKAFAGGARVVYCPCSSCQNHKYLNKEDVQLHLCKFGFMPNYMVWRYHGEADGHAMELNQWEDHDRMDEMLDDLGRGIGVTSNEGPPPEDVQKFYKVLEASEEKLHDFTEVTVLQAVTRLMSMKAKFNFSNNCYNAIIGLIIDVLPANHKMPKDMYQSKKILAGLGMNYEKIDVCEKNCMLFSGNHVNDTHCMHCGSSRYVQVTDEEGVSVTTRVATKQLRYMPITARLKRLYMSKETSKHMRWHKEGRRVQQHPDFMVHPSDGQAWQELDRFDPSFASDPRSVRLGLSTDGFTPFNTSAAPYSCWPVFIMPYNLPPEMCLKEGFIFLALIIPGPKHPGKDLNVFMRPLIDELKTLWQGVRAYDSVGGEEFMLRAAYLWSVHDLPAYGIWSGWCVHGRLCCPICMEDTDAFRLKHGQKYTFFDCHRRWLPSRHRFRSDTTSFRRGEKVHKGPPKRRTGEQISEWHGQLVESAEGGFVGYGTEHNWTHISSLWELPYAKHLILPYNIDLMHQERNVCESIISMVFDITDKTKDNVQARKDIADHCARPWLELKVSLNGKESRPRAPYCLRPDDRKHIFRWLKNLKFPDRYAANIRRSVNVSTGKLNGLKSHDYHIMMERLVPVMFRGYFDDSIWRTLAELSYFYRQLCGKEISKSLMQKFERGIPLLVCKLEKMFPPGFMNVMQHLLVHLPWEAMVAGPAQFRWMYSQERELKKLRATVRNKARVEGCIAEAYAIKEITNFSTKYFAYRNNVHAPTSRRYHPREAVIQSELQIFQWEGQAVGSSSYHHVTYEEWNSALLYMYSNMVEVEKYFE